MPTERRSSGLLRVPFVRRCRMQYTDRSVYGFVVNVNVLGAYVAAEAGKFPALGESVVCYLTTADNSTQMPIAGEVAWINAHQPHPVHSLPPGFGIKFLDLADEHRRRIGAIVDEYIRRHPQQAR